MPDAMPTPKQMFLDTFSQEHATTMRVLNAFPAKELEFKPHDRSQSARALAWTFVIEQALLSGALTNSLKLDGGSPKPPEDFKAIVDQFDSDFKGLVDLIKKTSDTQFNTGTVKFFSGPGQMSDFPIPQFAWFMLCDQIHHRGQLSVYVRMAGGKVPSIYGPSADEPWM
jgi:uncharacterized damage-inducible protein DinB